jgi:5'-deoxynucleotidase YfbR-like HD superfamily hydrolase
MDWIQTYTGKQFYPLAPRHEDVDIIDIAHALSMQCRFNGHCRTFYSVAEHCVRVSQILEGDDAPAGLLHDAAEAYVGDLPRPVKGQLPAFERVEDQLLAVIFARFNLAYPLSAAVKAADDQLLATEARDLMDTPPQAWRLDIAPLTERIEPMSAGSAKRAFMDRFESLGLRA